MKTPGIAALVLLGVSSAAAAEAPKGNPYVTVYPFNTAIVRYEIRTEVGHGPVKGGPAPKKMLGRGTQVIWIKGDRLAKSTHVDGREFLEIYTPDHLYAIDIVAKTGTRIDNPKKPGRLAWAGLSDDEKRAFHGRLASRGVVSFDLPHLGRRVGRDTVLRERCDVYELRSAPAPAPGPAAHDVSMTTCVGLAGIPLRAVRASFLRREEMVATKIEKNVRIPDSRFAVPAAVAITDDSERSEAERRHAVARFELFRSGTPIVVRLPVRKPAPGITTTDQRADPPGSGR